MLSELLTLNNQLTSIFVDLPTSIGQRLSAAISSWDGTIQGFFRSVAAGFASMSQQIASELICLAIVKMIANIISSIGGGLSTGMFSGHAGIGAIGALGSATTTSTGAIGGAVSL